MRRLLIVSDSPALPTGLGRVVREIAGRAVNHPDLEVHVAGWFHEHALLGDPIDLPYPVTPCSRAKPEYSMQLLQTLQPHLILCIGDPDDFSWWAAAKGRSKLVGYLNIDGAPLASQYEQVLDSFDVLTTTSEFGARVIGRPGVVPIHHGVDMQVFAPRPVPTFLGRDTSQTFVVLINGQNTFRKNLSVALQGFSLFSRGKEDHVLCYANTRPYTTHALDPKGPNLIDLVFELGIQKLVSWNPQNRGPFETVPDEFIAELYNGASVLLNTSLGEGFGLPLLEAQAVGCVPIAPLAHSAEELLSGGRGFLIPPSARFRTEYGGDGSIVSADAVASHLERAYQEWRAGTLKDRGRLGMQFAMSRPWDRTWSLLQEQIEQNAPERPKVPRRIDPYMRQHAKRAVNRVTVEDSAEPYGVLKLGGLGDMLQTARVIRAASAATGRRAIVFCNKHQEAFLGLSEVAEVIPIREQAQDEACATFAPAFDMFLDVRYVSRNVGRETAYFQRHRWFYENWAHSNARLESLGEHSTKIMLQSLGLPDTDIRPIYEDKSGHLPEKLAAIAGTYVAVATGGGALGQLKQWPLDQWMQFVALVDRYALTLVQVGGKDDPTIPSAFDARGLPLNDTAKVIEAARSLVGIEGGMVHLAAAVSTPAIVIFGPTPMRPFAYPWNVNLGRFDCPPCWWTLPTWGTQTCALGEPTCVNFPEPDVVANEVCKTRKLVAA